MFGRSMAKFAEGANASRSRAFEMRSSTRSCPLTTVTAAGVFCKFSERFSAVTTTSSSSPDDAGAGGVKTWAPTGDDEIPTTPSVERQDIPSTPLMLLIANSAPLILDLSGGLSSNLIRSRRQSAHSAAPATIAFAYVFYRQYQLNTK